MRATPYDLMRAALAMLLAIVGGSIFAVWATR